MCHLVNGADVTHRVCGSLTTALASGARRVVEDGGFVNGVLLVRKEE